VISSPPIALSIAGSDSSGGAGIQADLKTFAALGVYGVNAVTAIVAEIPGEVVRMEPCDSTLLHQQLNRVHAGFPVAAAKTGMLASAKNVEVVVGFFQENREIQLVIDPIFRATADDVCLLERSGVAILIRDLLPLASLITPNRMEAETILGKAIETVEDFESAPRELFETHGCPVLLKGGHFPQHEDDMLTDVAWLGDGELLRLRHKRQPDQDLHGTGCALSSALTACLALGRAPAESLIQATEYLQSAMDEHFHWPNEKSGGVAALNHFPNGATVPPS